VRQNEAFNAPPAAIAAAESLAQPNAVCAFTGQQAGLFGGPLYTIFKALTLLGWAEKLRSILNRPVVPVFWIASDDHDFEEVRWTGFPDLDNQVNRLSVSIEGFPERTPVSQLVLGESIRDVISALSEAQLKTEFSPDVAAALAEDYDPTRTMSEAFGRWLARLLGPLGLVMFDPSDRAAKALFKPLIKQELEGHSDTAAALSEMNQRINEAGYEQQVAHPANHTHLFYNHEGRHAVKTDDDGTMRVDAEESSHSVAEWVQRLDTHPESFSPGVLLRPVAQSRLFPVVSVVCGPSEIAYWAQSRALFDRFETPMPVVLPRSRATIVEAKNRKKIEALGHDVTEFFGDIEALINAHFERSFPTDLEQVFDQERVDCRERIGQLRAKVVAFEPTLDKTFEVSAGRVDSTWEHLKKKVFQAHKRKGDEIRARFYQLAAHLRPEGKPQERVFGVTYFLNKYGFGFINTVKEQLEIGTPDHQIIEP
jgi:bacillithiol biosynthesis cysteine-adding enzyme BshC